MIVNCSSDGLWTDFRIWRNLYKKKVFNLSSGIWSPTKTTLNAQTVLAMMCNTLIISIWIHDAIDKEWGKEVYTDKWQSFAVRSQPKGIILVKKKNPQPEALNSIFLYFKSTSRINLSNTLMHMCVLTSFLVLHPQNNGTHAL